MGQVHNRLCSTRFVNLCLANLLVNLFVFAQLPLWQQKLPQPDAAHPVLCCGLLAFCIGMIVPGPFVAHLLEKYRRKLLYLQALVVLVLCAVGAFCLPDGQACILVSLLFALEGAAYGVMQIAMGTTIVNDMLVSAQRTKGDCFYAWAGRIGMPGGLLAGSIMSACVPAPGSVWWAAVAPAVAYLLVAQTTIPVKAPVRMPVVALDRFFLPSSWGTMLALFPSAFVVGLLLSVHTSMAGLVALLAGYVLAFLLQRCVQVQRFHFTRICLGYVFLAVALAIDALHGGADISAWLPDLSAGCGCALVSANLLVHFVEHSEHCQRGTAQNTHLLVWTLAFCLGMGLGMQYL